MIKTNKESVRIESKNKAKAKLTHTHPNDSLCDSSALDVNKKALIHNPNSYQKLKNYVRNKLKENFLRHQPKVTSSNQQRKCFKRPLFGISGKTMLDRCNSSNRLVVQRSKIRKFFGNLHPKARRTNNLSNDCVDDNCRGVEKNDQDPRWCIYCSICLSWKCSKLFYNLTNCNHQVCISCGVNHVYNQISDFITHKICCHECTISLHPGDIEKIIHFESIYGAALLKEFDEMDFMPSYEPSSLMERYETVYLDRTLSTIPNIRFCPKPDCTFAVVADNCESCPELTCGKCHTHFCYHCKGLWHENRTCIESQARNILLNLSQLPKQQLQRLQQIHNSVLTKYQHNNTSEINGVSSDSGLLWQNVYLNNNSTIGMSGVKLCPCCGCAVSKDNDGKCNLTHCVMCGTSFCWLCMKEANDKHYFGANGCTYYGKSKWSKRKVLKWKLGLILSGPVWIFLGAAFFLPVTFVTLPIYLTSLMQRMISGKMGVFCQGLTLGGTIGLSIAISPVVYVLLLLVGIPLVLGHVYIETPLSIRRELEKDPNRTHKKNLKDLLMMNDSELDTFLSHSRRLLETIIAEEAASGVIIDQENVAPLLISAMKRQLSLSKPRPINLVPILCNNEERVSGPFDLFDKQEPSSQPTSCNADRKIKQPDTEHKLVLSRSNAG